MISVWTYLMFFFFFFFFFFFMVLLIISYNSIVIEGTAGF